MTKNKKTESIKKIISKGVKDIETVSKNINDSAVIIKVISDYLPFMKDNILIGIRKKINFELKHRRKEKEGKI